MTDQPTRRTFLRALTTAAATPLLGRISAAQEIVAQEIESLSRFGDSGGGFPGLREHYLLDPRVSYLNHASIGTVPRSVHSAGIRFREICEENPWLYIWGGAWEEPRERVRQKSAKLLGCDPELVAITHNTTEGFNVLARGLPLARGDEVLFSTLNHAGASICWEHFGAERGYTVRVFDFPIGDVPGLTSEDVVRLHREEIRPNTRVLVVPHIDNIVGLRHPLPELAAMAKENGVEYVLVDGAQSAGMIPLQLAESEVDAYATSPHKWVQSVKGLGLLYLSRGLVESLPPFWVTWGQERWRGTARVFEDYGTRDLPEVLSLGAALDFQAALGQARKEGEYERMFQTLKEKVEGTSGLVWRSPRSWEMGSVLVGVGLGRPGADEVSDTLFREHGIVVRSFPAEGLNSLRVSPNLMNTDEESDRLLNILEVMK
jgi:isopenicillin-N epimerase